MQKRMEHIHLYLKNKPLLSSGLHYYNLNQQPAQKVISIKNYAKYVINLRPVSFHLYPNRSIYSTAYVKFKNHEFHTTEKFGLYQVKTATNLVKKKKKVHIRKKAVTSRLRSLFCKCKFFCGFPVEIDIKATFCKGLGLTDFISFRPIPPLLESLPSKRDNTSS